MTAIVDYGVGNLFSLQCSLRHIGASSVVTSDRHVLESARRVILPGVGAFADAMGALRRRGLAEAVRGIARDGKPLLGICLGMQLLFDGSCEYGQHEGLGLIPGRIEDLAAAPGMQGLKVPHIGWNSLGRCAEHPLLSGTADGAFVYYVHSFYAPRGEYTVAASGYGGAGITGIAAKGNVMGAQFHPEKSGDTGLAILRAFCGMGGAL